MRKLLLLASLGLLTLAAIPAVEPTPTPPASTWTPGPLQPKPGTTAPAPTMVPSSLATPGPAQSPIAIPATETPAAHRGSWLLALGIATLVTLAGLSLWLKPFRRRQ